MSTIRAAFDIGSSHHKLTVAVIPSSTTSSYTPRILHETSIRVPLADALNTTSRNELPQYILSSSLAAIRTLHTAALSHGATQFAGVATQVFRVTLNGHDHLDRIYALFAIPITVLSPVEEGHLAFYSFIASPSATRLPFPLADALPHLVVWDSGGASTQWTHLNRANALTVHALPIGSSTARAIFREAPEQKQFRAMLSLQAEPIRDKELQSKLRSGIVIGLGSATSMFRIASTRLDKPSFSRWDVQKLLQQCDAADFSLPRLHLLFALMSTYGVEKVIFVPANGSCIGLLASKDKQFWPSIMEGEIDASGSDHVVGSLSGSCKCS